ncbi:MAG: amidohydrolase family protein [Rhodospirillaceae bacterium]
MNANFIIRGARVLTPEADPHQPPFQDIMIRGGEIAQISETIDKDRADGGVQEIDASGMLAIPGFVNAHYHSHDTLAKGVMEETPLETWRLLALPPQYPKRSKEEIRARTLIGALECLRSGMTCIQDMVTLYPFDPEHLETVIEAYEEIGIRAVVALQYADIRGLNTIPFWKDVFPIEMHKNLSTAAEPDPDVDQLGHFVERWLKSSNTSSRISWALGPSAPERCSTDLIERTVALADEFNLPIFSHIYESKGMALQARMEYPAHGGSLIRRLEAEGLLGPRLNLAHSVWLLQDEIEILAKTGTKVVINPLSNLKLKSGIPPIRALEQAGVSLALGCDNCSCSDAQNMFQAMKLFCLMVAISHEKAGREQSPHALKAATEGGARAVLMDKKIGKLVAGMKADITLINLEDPSYIPLNSAQRQLVYTEGGRGVHTVIVDGKVVIQNGKLQTMDEATLFQEVRDVIPNFQTDFREIEMRVKAMSPWLDEAHRRIWETNTGGDRLFKDPLDRDPPGF